jgi:hypothetical protein
MQQVDTARFEIGQFSSAEHHEHQTKYVNDDRMEEPISALCMSRPLHSLYSTLLRSYTYSIGIELAWA